MNHLRNKRTSLTASLVLTGLASTGTSVIWNGLPFIAKRDFGFSESENLSLYLLIGFVYVSGALSSGVCTRLLNPYISLRTIIAMLLITVAGVCSLPLFFASDFVMWVSGGVAGFCSAWLWPIVESYLVAGRHGKEMRRAIGWWNLVWMVAVAGVMLAMAPLMEKHASMVIVGLGVMNLIAIGVLPWYAKNPPVHEEAVSKKHVPDGYRELLKGARVLLPLSYVFNGLLAPLLPFIFASIAIDIFWQTPVASTWMVSRVLATALMWHFESWGQSPGDCPHENKPKVSNRHNSSLHLGGQSPGDCPHLSGWNGKWSILWGALFVMGMGFVCILSAVSLPILIFGLVAFGAGMGVTYYAALYYAMAVGNAKVDAGGKHEAFIGGGYMVGPILGLASLQFASTSFTPIIYVVLGLLTIAVLALSMFWRNAR
ncbi:MAG: MFS transporter [Planctomycetes bacterium]|nr:MFS transporter [Planctomycetota bacterium]